MVATPLVRTTRGVNLGALRLERAHPFVDAGRRLVRTGPAAPAFDMADLEEIVELLLAQLVDQPRKKRAAGLADSRIAERARAGLRHMSDAGGLVAPDRRLLPELEVHARRAVAVEKVGVPERQPDVVQHQEGLRAEAFLVQAARQAVEPLLHGLVVRVLDEDGEELQRVAVRLGRAAMFGVGQIELGPAPAFGLAVQLMSGRLALDRRDLEEMVARALLPLHPRIVRAAAAEDLDGIGHFRAEAEGPQQPAREDTAFDLAVVGAVAHLHFVAVVQLAMKLPGAAVGLGFDEVTLDVLIRCERALDGRAHPEVELSGVGWRPNLCGPEKFDARILRQRTVGLGLSRILRERMSCEGDKCERDNHSARHLYLSNARHTPQMRKPL